ncbi:MAG: serine/threonine protein kinase, partial [Planctomycetota bacterium]
MTRFGSYEVVGELGRGGMGVVYEARHPHTPRRLALKRILRARSDAQGLARFDREARLLAQVRHPSVVRAHDAGRDEQGNPFLVTDLVEGEGLDEVLRRGPLEPTRAAELVAALAEGIAAVHRVGVLHRDLKPANVILTPEGRPVLIDFGLARPTGDAESLTRSGVIVGTPSYMAPEQAEGLPSAALDARVDVYGLGAILYACLAGRPPFEGSGPLQVAKKVLCDPIRWPVASPVPPALRAVAERALAKAPADRFAGADELAHAVRESIRAPTPSPSRAPLFLAGGGAFVALALAIAA